MAAISGKLARIRYTAAVPTSSTDQAADLAVDGVTLTINATGRRRWDPTSTKYAVYSDESSTSIAVPSSLYRIDHAVGRMVFSAAGSTSATITVDVPWLATSYLTQAHAWTLNTDVDMLDCTAFSTGASGAAWRSYVPGLTDASVTISRFFSTGDTGPVFIDRAVLNSPFYLELILNSTDQAGYVCYGTVQTDSLSEDVGGLVGEEITFKPTGQVYYTT